jgi:hypothetical protein
MEAGEKGVAAPAACEVGEGEIGRERLEESHSF